MHILWRKWKGFRLVTPRCPRGFIEGYISRLSLIVVLLAEKLHLVVSYDLLRIEWGEHNCILNPSQDE